VNSDSDSDHDDSSGTGINGVNSLHEHQADFETSGNGINMEGEPLDNVGFAEEILHKHWAAGRIDESNDSDLESDRGEPFYPQLEDGNNSDDEEVIDWDAIEAQSCLSAWDQLGEGYEADAAAICKFKYTQNSFYNLIFINSKPPPKIRP
jgi:hypothetical protein